ncbi:MAG: FAD-dependent oxidoreductase, partial [Candidatus Thorarchaeota archaeon]
TARDAISMKPDNLGRVSVIGGNSRGCFAAIYLSSRSESVDIFERDSAIGTDLGRTTRWVILKSLNDRGVNVHTSTEISQVTRSYIQIDTEDDLTLFEADTVVVAAKPQPRTRLIDAAKAEGLPVDVIGSAAGQDGLLDIVHNAFDYANTLEL